MIIGISLTTSPEREDGFTAVELAKAALAAGHGVRFFLMDDGVQHVRAHPKNPWAAEFAALLEAGATVTLCATNCGPRGLEKGDAIPGVLFGSQYDHAAIVEGSDRFLAFT